jgi:putative ABC transport system permease protein
VIRSDALAQVVPLVVSAIRALDGDIPIGELRPMGEVVDGSLRRPRVQSIAMLTFAATAVLLAAFGIYGAVATAVIERRREFGVRLALGARPLDVWWAAARDGAVPALIGLAAGVPLAFGSGWVLRQQLFAIGPADGPTLLAVTAVLAIVAILAAVVPAWRATRVDPVIAIRT